MPRSDHERQQLARLERVQAELQRVITGLDPVLAASALSYVLASHAAEHAGDLQFALDGIDGVTRVMKEQIRIFGVGRRHP